MDPGETPSYSASYTDPRCLHMDHRVVICRIMSGISRAEARRTSDPKVRGSTFGLVFCFSVYPIHTESETVCLLALLVTRLVKCVHIPIGAMYPGVVAAKVEIRYDT